MPERLHRLRPLTTKPRLDITGMRSGRLTAIRPFGICSHNNQIVWLCACDCGRETTAYAGKVTAREAKSCGCMRAAKVDARDAQDLAVRTLRYRAQVRGLTWKLDDEVAIALLGSDCHYCGAQPGLVIEVRGTKFVRNGLDRVDSSVGYVPGNVVPCCGPCNLMKRNMSYAVFMGRVARIYDHRIAPAPRRGSCR